MESTTNKKVVRDKGHPLKNGNTGKNHFQKKSGDGSHVFVESAKNGSILVTTANQEASEELAGDMAEFGADMTDTVENFATNVFGDNEFGQFINELNPLNLGFSDLFKYADETLNGNTKATTSNGITTTNNSTNTTTNENTSTSNSNANTTSTNTTSTTNCDEDGCN